MSPVKLYRSSVVANAAGVTQQTIQAWVRDGKLVPVAVNDGGEPLFSLGQLREQHQALIRKCHDRIAQAAQALDDDGVLDDYGLACDALCEPQP